LESYNVTHTCKFEKDEDANKDENFEYLNWVFQDDDNCDFVQLSWTGH
jgi:hypothetical protein